MRRAARYLRHAGVTATIETMTRSTSVRVATLGAVFFAAATGLTACGGGSGGSCGKVEPCGGNLVGHWVVSGSCVNKAALMTDLADVFATLCPEFSVGTINYKVSGSLTFNTDMSYAFDLMEAADFKLNFPASCVQSVGATCADVQATLADPTDPTTSVTCAGTSGCTCTFVTAPSTSSDTGTYTLAGTAAMLTNASGTSGGEYCVQGNDLHLTEVDRTMNMGPMGQATINQDIVAKKQ